MADLGMLLEKLGRNAGLTPGEISELHQKGSNLEASDTLVQSWVQIGTVNPHFDEMYAGNAEFGRPPVASAHFRRVSGFTVPNSTWTDIEWDSQQWDTGVVRWDIAAPGDMYTDLGAHRRGLLFSGTAEFADDATGMRGVRLLYNDGANAITFARLSPTAAGLSTFIPFSCTVIFDEPEVYQLQVFQTSGGDLTSTKCRVLVQWVGV